MQKKHFVSCSEIRMNTAVALQREHHWSWGKTCFFLSQNLNKKKGCLRERTAKGLGTKEYNCHNYITKDKDLLSCWEGFILRILFRYLRKFHNMKTVPYNKSDLCQNCQDNKVIGYFQTWLQLIMIYIHSSADYF